MKLKQKEISFEKYLIKGLLPCIDVTVQNKNLIFLIDSGSDLSYIDSNIAEDLQLPIKDNDIVNKLQTLGSTHYAPITYDVDFKIDDSLINNEFIGVEIKQMSKKLKVKFDGILGLNILKQIKANISFEDNKMIYSYNED